jgi:hypothetical protein
MYCTTSFAGSSHGKGEDQCVENICKNIAKIENTKRNTVYWNRSSYTVQWNPLE